MRGLGFRLFVFLVLCLPVTGRLFATTKGLSEIITPDLQPEGDLSWSFQAQDKLIGNPYQFQIELADQCGIASRLFEHRIDQNSFTTAAIGDEV